MKKKILTSLFILATAAAHTQWSITGNSGTNPPTNFLGTTDAKALVFKTNNQLSGILNPSLGSAGFGYLSLYNNTGGLNTAIGYRAMYTNTSGGDNTAVGEGALEFNTTAGANAAVGEYALHSTTTGGGNTSVGAESLASNTTGSGNTALGSYALLGCVTGTNNTALGYNADFSVTSTSYTNATVIGYSASVTASNQMRLGSTGVTSIGGTVGWTTFSDGRFKSQIEENVPGLDFIKQLRPVTYTLNTSALSSFLRPPNKTDKHGNKIPTLETNDNEGVVFSGFLAQEVASTAQKLGYDFHGVDKPKNDKDLYGLRYAEFVTPLVKAVQELSNENDSLKTQISTLQSQNNQLQSQINDILQQINNLKSGNNGSGTSSTTPVLKQNAPNPFNSNTTISYFLPSTISNAQLIVSNVKGQLLKTINLNNNGEGLVTIQGGELAAGSYFYTLVADGKRIDTKQMILTR